MKISSWSARLLPAAAANTPPAMSIAPGTTDWSTWVGWRHLRRTSSDVEYQATDKGRAAAAVAKSVWSKHSHPALIEARAEGEGEMTEIGRFATRPWTPEDDEILRSLALRGVDARVIGNQLNRTAVAVRSRARRLNILLKKTKPKRYQMGWGRRGNEPRARRSQLIVPLWRLGNS